MFLILVKSSNNSTFVLYLIQVLYCSTDYMVHRAERASKCSANFAVSLIFLSLLISFSPVGLRQFINGSLSLSLSLCGEVPLFFLMAINFVRECCCCCCSCYSIYTGMMSYSRNCNLGQIKFHPTKSLRAFYVLCRK